MSRVFYSVAALGLWLVLLCTSARAAGLIDRIDQQLQHPAVVRGQFEQQRQLAGFSKPLQSQGRFVVARARGALWLTEKPFASELILTRDTLIQKSGGTVSQKLDSSREPALRAINSVLFALLAGDLHALESRFDISGRVDSKGWQLTLLPRDATWKQVMSRIDLTGGAFVTTLDLTDANGDRTLIRFLNNAADSTLRADEASRLE